MLVATAGHIDHGKTALVRALTGVETDRLPEERARGISIDLGFAYWRSGDDELIGFVDVPGHERFIRNMLAGVSAVDFALLVVAANDGVMPQTVEHAQVLHLLGIERGVLAITKSDLVSPERAAQVEREVRTLLAGTTLAHVPAFAVSSMTGAGVAELAAAIRTAAKKNVGRDARGHAFRLGVDQVFCVTGAGTVVTGTVLDGSLEPGARLVISPHGLDVRVRGLQRAGEKVARVTAGERCALNLAGVEVAQGHRGDWLVSPDMHAPTARIEARVKVLRTRGEPLRHHQPVHLHIGAADILARVLISGLGAIGPGEDGVAHLALEHRTAAVAGDRFVLRDSSGRETIGGGRVIDPFPPSHRRRQSSRAPVTAALERPGAAAALEALLDIEKHEVDTRHFERSFNLTAAAAQEIYRRADAVLLGRARMLALPTARIEAATREIVQALRAFHSEHPEAPGMTLRELGARIGLPLSAEALAALAKDLAEKNLIAPAGTLVRLPGHATSFSAADAAQWERLLEWLEERGTTPFTESDLGAELRTGEAAVRALLHRRRVNGDIWRITDKRFLTRAQVAALAARAALVAREVGGAGFSAAQFRDAINTGRMLAIQILEFFDGLGVTRRRDNLRTVSPDFEQVVGAARPYFPIR